MTMAEEISELDLKLVYSQEMSQFDTGGGELTASEIPDGVLLNFFDSTAELDGVFGRVKIGKGGVVVDVDSTARFQAAHMIISEKPSNPLVDLVLFSTGDAFDRRPQHVAYMESFLANGSLWHGYLKDTVVAGVKSIEIWQRPKLALPEVGATYVLIADYGLPGQFEQPIVCLSVKSTIRTFVDAVGGGFKEYEMEIVTMTIGSKLLRNFSGPPVSYVSPDLRVGNYARILETRVNDATDFKGAARLTQPFAINTSELYVDEIHAKLIPAAAIPSARGNLSASGIDISVIPASDGFATVETSVMFGANRAIYTGTPISPGSLSMTAGPANLSDANGILYSGAAAVGTVDYARGAIVGGDNCPSYGGLKRVRFRPGAALEGPLQTVAISVTAVNQSDTFNLTLPHQPEPGSLRIAFRAQKKWYDLKDKGDGVCKGLDDAYGTAQINFAQRYLKMTLGAIPDAYTYILISYAIKSYTFNRGGNSIGKAFFEFTTQGAMAPGGVSVAWHDGVNYEAHDDGAGNLVGDAAGRVWYAQRKLRIYPDPLPAPGTPLHVTLTPRAVVTESVPAIPLNEQGERVIQLAHAPIVPGSVQIEFSSIALPQAPQYDAANSPPLVGGNYGSGSGSGSGSSDGNTYTQPIAAEPEPVIITSAPPRLAQAGQAFNYSISISGPNGYQYRWRIDPVNGIDSQFLSGVFYGFSASVAIPNFPAGDIALSLYVEKSVPNTNYWTHNEALQQFTVSAS
jgi:hypothetical protein